MSNRLLGGHFGGIEMSYEAWVEDFAVESKGSTARYVCTSYCRSDADQARPVAFVFNGGPGSSSVWLHFGIGPRRPAELDQLQPRSTPPYELADNQDSPLDVTDLVFIDPPGTGYSRVIDGDEQSFYDSTADAIACVDFIAQWKRRHRREQAPTFLIGESYGAMRAALVAKLAAGGPFATGSLEAVSISGVVLVGATLAMGVAGEDAECATALPSLAAAAWYHGRLPGPPVSLEHHVESAREFAGGAYLVALAAGGRLPNSDRHAVAQRLHQLTGLPASELERAGLRLDVSSFSRQLLGEAGLQIGMYDARFTLPLMGAGADPVADDPAMGQYAPMFAGVVTSYLRDELKADYDEQYRAIEFARVNFRWDYGRGPGVLPVYNYSVELATAMRRNSRFEVLVCSGLYDLVATSGAVEHALAHAPVAWDRVTLRRYESGHMPYLGEASRAQLALDLRAFFRRLTP